MTLKVKPLGKRILVKREEAVKTKGGLFLPETAKEKPRQGEVVAAGPGHTKEDGTLTPLEVKVGDRVLFGPYAGTEVKERCEEGEYLIMSEDDVLAVIES